MAEEIEGLVASPTAYAIILMQRCVWKSQEHIGKIKLS